MCVCSYARTPRQLTFPWEVKADVSTLFTDIEMAKGSFPARRNHLKYELSQSIEQLHSDAIQLFQGMGTLQDINDAAQVVPLPLYLVVWGH